jgi:hypothetical protein
LEAQNGGAADKDAEMGDASDGEEDEVDVDAERRRIADHRAMRDQAKADGMSFLL